MALGIMGGTFNPIHIGHLMIAEYVYCKYNLDRVIFIPTGNPPHKPEGITSPKIRYEIVEKAVENNPHFEASSMETYRTGKTFTVDTISELEKLYPDEKLFYIIGTDTLFDIEVWKTPELLKGRVTFIVYDRIGEKADSVLKNKNEIEMKYGLSFEICSGPMIDISSTMIRRRIKNGQSVKYMVPDTILCMMEKIEVSAEQGYTEIVDELQVILGDRRLRHTLGVVDAAERLSFKYNTDPEKTRLAALLHDIAKPLRHPEMLKMILDSGIILDEDTLMDPDLLHGHAGALIAEKRFAVLDQEILDAIRYHTTGREDMSLLEKVIYLADFIESGRNFPGVESIRAASERDLDDAVLKAMESTIEHLKLKKRKIHTATIAARDFLNRRMNMEK